ncbi:MAG: alpha/beta hydrolase family protein [Planctomycetaceae bacterium]
MSPVYTEQGKGGMVIHLYGHNGSHLDYNASADSYKRFRQHLSERGFWLVIPDLGPRHWMNKAAVENVDRVIEQMTEKNGIDKDQVHLLGTSMGGGGSLVYVTRRPGKIRSVASVFPMTDYVKWEKELNGNYSRGIVTAHGVDFEKREELFRELSPTTHIDAFEKTSVYLLHGASDNICPLSHSQEFAKLMSEKKYAVILKEVPGIGHTDAIMEDYQDEVADFLTSRK